MTTQSVAAGYTAENLVTASQAATGDLSAQSLLVKIFGTIADNPLAAVDGTAGAGDVLGNIFMVINLGLLTLGSIYLSYKALAAITQTAHEGEFMGQAFNSVWVPIRITTGIFSLIPIAGGWSIIQVAMLWFGIMGAGLGNIAWNGVVGSGWLPYQTAALVPASAQPADKKMIVELAKMHVCVLTHNIDKQALGGTGDYGVVNTVGQLGGGLRFGSQKGQNAECGIVLASSADVGNDAESYRQRAAARDAANAEFLQLNTAIKMRVKDFADDIDATLHEPDHLDHLPRIPTSIELDKMSHVYDLRSQKAVAGALRQTDAMPAAFKTMRDRARSDGFTTAGAFYLTMANAAHQVNQLTAGVMPTIAATALPPQDGEVAWKYAYSLIHFAEQASQKFQASGGKDENSAWKLMMAEMGTDSIGQGIVNRITQDSSGQPVLVRIKNLADYMVGTASVAITASGVVKSMIEAAKTAASGVPIIGGLVAGATTLASGPLSGWLDIIGSVAGLAMGFFLMASIFLPMIPFIIFMGQILNWLITVVEGVAAAPFLAFAHLDTDGEGLGEKTRYGYTFMLSSFMRPVMLVLGFVFACILLETIGGFVMQIFPMVLADVQSNSMTGFFSILGFTALFFIMMAGLINSCMSVTYLLPDAIFAFIGAHSSATASVGRDSAQSMAGAALGGAHAVGKIKTGGLRRHAQPHKNEKREPNGLAAA